MRHFDIRERAASLLLACALPALLSCAENAYGIVDPPETRIISVAVTLDSASIAVGHLAHAAAIAVDTAGEVITGHEVEWASLAPQVASVSADGIASAIAPGSAPIEARVLGRVGVATVTVTPDSLNTAPETADPTPPDTTSPAPAPPQVSAVTVTLDSASLTVGHVAKAAATATDVAGAVMSGQEVAWISLSPAVATVSSTGLVSAVAPGTAGIQALVAGKAGLATVTVVMPPAPPAPPPPSTPPPGAVSHDFNDGTMGPFVNVWEDGHIDFPVDPTGSGRGKVARMTYSLVQGNPGVQSSDDTDIAYNRSTSRVRYNETIWMKGELYLPYSGSTTNANHNRKLIDFTGAGVGGIHTRVTLHRRDMKLMVSIVDWMGGSVRETISEWSGITLADDQWHTIEVRMTTNSADKIRDGILEIYMNGSPTPTYSRTAGLGWITEAFPGGTFFSYFYLGSQLTVDPNEPVYNEYRYWDNVAFASSRIGS